METILSVNPIDFAVDWPPAEEYRVQSRVVEESDSFVVESNIVRLLEDGTFFTVASLPPTHPCRTVAEAKQQVINLAKISGHQIDWHEIPQDSPHSQTAPKVSAKTRCSASIAAKRWTSGASRCSGMFGMRS